MLQHRWFHADTDKHIVKHIVTVFRGRASGWVLVCLLGISAVVVIVLRVSRCRRRRRFRRCRRCLLPLLLGFSIFFPGFPFIYC